MIGCIDFGASQTKVTYRQLAAAAGELVMFGRYSQFPTAVFLRPDGTLLVGHDADAYQGRNPSRYFRWLKQHVHRADGVAPAKRTIRQGPDVSLSLLDGVATVLSHAYTALVEAIGAHPAALVLTHPAEWQSDDRDLLRRAGQKAGIACRVELAAEPVAAATHHLRRGALPAGAGDAALAVFDLGASTFDAAVLDRVDKTVPAPRFCRGLLVGGDDFDAAVLDLVATLLPERAGEDFERLRTEAAYEMWSAARSAKERLSTEDEIVFAHQDLPDVVLYRSDFEDAIEPLVESCVSLLRQGIDALPRTTKVGAVALSGGSSRIPLVQALVGDLAQDIGAELATGDGTEETDWEHSVALGAVHLPASVRGQLRRTGQLPTERRVEVAGHGNLASVTTNSTLRLTDRTGTDRGSATPGRFLTTKVVLATDPGAGRILTGTDTGLVQEWSVNGSGALAPLGYLGADFRWMATFTGWSVTSVAIRGDRAACAREEQPGAVFRRNSRRWRQTAVLHRHSGTSALAFLDSPEAVLQFTSSHMHVHCLADGGQETSVPFALAEATEAAVLPKPAMVFLSRPDGLEALRVRTRTVTSLWRLPFEGGAIECALLRRRPVLLAFSKPHKAITVLDGLTGSELCQVPMKKGAVHQICATGNAGEFVVRQGRQLSALVLEQA